MIPQNSVKCSVNKKGYRDLTPEFVSHGKYEIDLVGSQGEDKHRKRQKDVVNALFEKSQVIMYIGDNKRVYRGVMKSKFEKNTISPFYLEPEVKDKAKQIDDISQHPFYTCKVAWERDPLMPEDEEFKRYKESWEGKCLRRTLVVL